MWLVLCLIMHQTVVHGALACSDDAGSKSDLEDAAVSKLPTRSDDGGKDGDGEDGGDGGDGGDDRDGGDGG